MSQFNNPKFNKIKKKWYNKLKKSGFEDIEQDETYLKQHSGKTGLTHEDPNARNAWDAYLSQEGREISESPKFNYFSECREFLETYSFKSKKERKMFEMHSEGEGERVIAKALKTYRRKVTETLKKLIKVMRGRK